MFFRKKIFGKILAIILATLLWLNPILIPVVWAEGEEQQEAFPTAEPTPEITPEATLPQSTISTGDANASSEVETTANTNETTVPGEIAVPEGDCAPPEGETECPGDVVVTSDNSADVSNGAGSSATTGDNQIEGSAGDATIQTGDATASGTINNEINSNTVVLEPTAEIELTVTPTPTETQTLAVENNNEGTVVNNASVSASTGENIASENLGEAAILTGDALAWASLFNLLNTNIVGSNFELLLLDILGNGNGNIDLNRLWQEILAKNGTDSLSLAGETSSSNLQLLVENLNQAYLENNVNVNAATGGNQADENENATIQTGEAAAMANVTNIVNTNILGAKFFFGVINILGLFEGNLILPRPEWFTEQSGGTSGQSPVIFINQNEAEIENQLVVGATTGGNEETNNQGNNFIKTGDAQAVANSFSLVNLNIWHNNWFFLIINNLGSWTGRIFGWSTPEAVEEPEEENQVFQLGLEGSPGSGGNLNLDGEDLALVSFQNQNQATVKNNIQTNASTGENQANENRGNAWIETGNAWSLANLFNFVNLNILGGRWFFGLVNVLGGWTGNTIFAYPDVTVGLSNGSGQAMVGETTEFTLFYKNQGYDEANDVVLKLELPEGVRYLSDTSEYAPVVLGRICTWNIGGLAAGEEGGFKIKVEILPDFSFEEKLSFWSRIIPQAHAAENQKEKQILVTAFIVTSDPESDFSNNKSLAKTLVYLPSSPHPESSINQEVDQRQPILEISAWNNVGEFVYPGDTVTFEITIRNKGEVPAYDVYLTQALYNGVPEDFGVVKFEIGKIEAGKGAKLSFGLKLADNGLLPVGHYYTIAKAFGTAPNGNKVSSNEARTDFNIKHKEIASLFEARAIGKEEKVLGAQEGECPINEEEILPYVLLFVLSSLWIVEKSRKIAQIIKKK